MSRIIRSRARWRQVAVGIASHLPVLGPAVAPTGGTDAPRYCYSVWLRHAARLQTAGLWNQPQHVLELGPGDSLGTGLAALLSGVQRYTGIDEVPYASLQSSHEMLHTLAELFADAAEIPDDSEFPDVRPRLPSYHFPAHLLSDAAEGLDARVRRIDDALKQSDSRVISYLSPTEATEAELDGTVDLLFSQAVLEHVDDLESAYQAMASWVREGGLVSHTIDFRAHFTSNEWDGHWTISDRVWSLMRGKRPYLLNRQAWSAHRRLLEGNGLEILELDLETAPRPRPNRELAKPFRHLSEDDLRTMTTFVIAQRH